MSRTLDQKIAETEAALARLREKARKNDARKKILIGGAVLAEIATDQARGAWLRDVLDRRVIADRDREMLDLPKREG